MPHFAALLLGLPALAIALVRLRRRRDPGALAAGALLVGAWGLTISMLVARAVGLRLFGAVGLFAWTVFAVLPLYLFVAALLLRTTRRRWAQASALAAALVLLVAVDAFLIEPRWLELQHVRIETARVSRPMRVAVLADIQTDRVGAYERRAIERAMAEAPDLVLLAGDYISVDGERFREQQDALREVFEETGLSAPLGVFAVRGNCDPPGWERVFEGLDVHVFEETGRVELAELAITGLSFPDSFRSAPETPPSERFEIVLGHAPDFALAPCGADLLVAGHCHGGQVRLPLVGALVTLSRVPRAWASGTRELRSGAWLCVSRGIGMERLGAPPLRFLCRPQVVILDLVPR